MEGYKPDNFSTSDLGGMSASTVNIKIRFTSPAFLGGAEGSSEIRTPPFKSLLRRCWRLASAGSFQYDARKLREEEGILFGHTWLKHEGHAWAARSPISISLYQAEVNWLSNWVADPKTKHPEVERAPGGMIGSHLYLGYGPLVYKGRTEIKVPPAIDAGSKLVLRISGRGMKQIAPRLNDILSVMHWIESIGGRGRNGWGSYVIEDVQGVKFTPSKPASDLGSSARALGLCLDQSWPCAVGQDQQGILAWSTKIVFKNWIEVMTELARLKIGLRTQFGFALNHGFQERHVLSYPITNHQLRAWPNERLANQLRFKVLPSDNGFVGSIVHVPAGIPSEMINKLHPEDRSKVKNIESKVWPQVHQFLDHEAKRW